MPRGTTRGWPNDESRDQQERNGRTLTCAAAPIAERRRSSVRLILPCDSERAPALRRSVYAERLVDCACVLPAVGVVHIEVARPAGRSSRTFHVGLRGYAIYYQVERIETSELSFRTRQHVRAQAGQLILPAAFVQNFVYCKYIQQYQAAFATFPRTRVFLPAAGRCPRLARVLLRSVVLSAHSLGLPTFVGCGLLSPFPRRLHSPYPYLFARTLALSSPSITFNCSLRASFSSRRSSIVSCALCNADEATAGDLEEEDVLTGPSSDARRRFPKSSSGRALSFGFRYEPNCGRSGGVAVNLVQCDVTSSFSQNNE